jgi:hypothetical protein
LKSSPLVLTLTPESWLVPRPVPVALQNAQAHDLHQIADVQ